MQSYIGVLGDPAKLELYSDDFYSILNWDESKSSFHLIGASENDVSKDEYKQMYDRICKNLQHTTYEPIPRLSGSTDFRSRIGLFPSSSSHLISGPSFSFAPYPVNSSSLYLQLKSKLLSLILRPFLPFNIRSLAYVPLGGKAAQKTKAMDFEIENLPELFGTLRDQNKFDWYYLEAGSGQDFLPISIISKVMESQLISLSSELDFNNFTKNVGKGSRIIVPNFIYGGGIKNQDHVKQLLEPSDDEIKLIPEIIIIGNLSEEDVSETYKLVNLVGELNEIDTIAFNSHQ